MSVNLKQLKYNKDLKPVNFEVKDGETVFILAENKEENKIISSLFEGKYSLIDGEFLVNQYSFVNKKSFKKQTIFIKNRRAFKNLIPIKMFMFFNLYFNHDFYLSTKMNYIRDKFNYLNLLSSKGYESEILIKEKINFLVEKFINNSTKIEEEWIDEFAKQIQIFDKKKISEVHKNIKEGVSDLILIYCKLIESNRNKELLITFLQSIFDKVSNLQELRYSCDCEYEYKKINKKINKDLFKFKQQKFIATKFLKIIELKINLIKREIRDAKYEISNTKKQIKISLINSDYKIKKVESLIKWKQLVDDQRHEFIKKQEKMIFHILKDEFNVLKGKVIEIIHKYHLELLSRETESLDSLNFKNNLIESRKKIISIYGQTNNWIKTKLEELSIEFVLSKKKIFASSLNFIYFELLISIIKNKKNIIFKNILNKLSKAEVLDLKIVLDNFVSKNNTSIIFIEKDLKTIMDFEKSIYKFEQCQLNIINFKEDNKLFFYNSHNKIFVDKHGTNLTINNQKINWSIKEDSNYLLLNPFGFYFNPKESGKNNVEFELKTRESNFNDKNMHEGFTKTGLRFYFYNKNKIEDNMKVYINESSILRKENE